jgi:hypothetical protein
MVMDFAAAVPVVPALPISHMKFGDSTSVLANTGAAPPCHHPAHACHPLRHNTVSIPSQALAAPCRIAITLQFAKCLLSSLCSRALHRHARLMHALCQLTAASCECSSLSSFVKIPAPAFRPWQPSAGSLLARVPACLLPQVVGWLPGLLKLLLLLLCWRRRLHSTAASDVCDYSNGLRRQGIVVTSVICCKLAGGAPGMSACTVSMRITAQPACLCDTLSHLHQRQLHLQLTQAASNWRGTRYKCCASEEGTPYIYAPLCLLP